MNIVRPIITTFLMAIATTQINASEQQTAIEEVVVTSTHLEETTPIDLSRYGNRLEIITAQQVLEHGFVDISQTIQMMVPGLHISPKNGPFDYFDASLHGSRTSEILWLIDGVRITNRLYNGTSPLDTVPAHMVERIEVLKGGQGIFYGTQSVGGVVNIVTKSFQNEADGSIGLSMNSNSGHSLNTYYRGSLGKHQLVAYASKDQSDGYEPYRKEDIQTSATNTDRGYEVNIAGLKYALNINERSRLSMQYQFTDNKLDYARPYLNNNTTNNREEDIVTLKYDLEIDENIDLFIKAYQHNWDTEYTRIYNELDANGNLTGDTIIKNNKSYWGYEDYGFNAMAKINYGGNFEYIVGLDQQNFSGIDDVWRIGKQKEKVNAVFMQLRTTENFLDNTLIALGARNNRASNMEDSTVWSLSGKHTINENLYLQLNFGTSFRMPDAEALFLNEYYDDNNDSIPDDGWFAIGNPDLEPEESKNINLSIGGDLSRLFDAKLSYEVVAFKRDISHYIDSYVPIIIGGVEGESFINSNDEVNVDGFEILATVSFTDNVESHISYTNTRAKFNNKGAQLTSIPREEAKLSIDYQHPSHLFGGSLNMNYVGDVNGRRGVKRGNYTVADLSAFVNVGSDQQHMFTLRLENIFDKEYATRIDRGSLDATGESYLYANLGMKRTVHASYTYQF